MSRFAGSVALPHSVITNSLNELCPASSTASTHAASKTFEFRPASDHQRRAGAAKRPALAHRHSRTVKCGGGAEFTSIGSRIVNLSDASVKVFRLFCDDQTDHLRCAYTRRDAVEAYETEHPGVWVLRALDETWGKKET